MYVDVMIYSDYFSVIGKVLKDDLVVIFTRLKSATTLLDVLWKILFIVVGSVEVFVMMR